MTLALDPNGPIYKAAKALGFNDPDAMSEGQLEEAVLLSRGALPPPPLSPFTQETEDFKARAIADAADRTFAINLAIKIAAAMKTAFTEFQDANTVRFNNNMQNLHLPVAPTQPPSVVQNYNRLQALNADLFLYLEAVTPGWTGNIGLPNHETQAVLLERLKSSYPDADAAVNKK